MRVRFGLRVRVEDFSGFLGRSFKDLGFKVSGLGMFRYKPIPLRGFLSQLQHSHATTHADLGFRV